ncbi:hypothetical protein EYF80_009625 [Liparis tanakae]|uniref:Uncharacterized protein n=1 Tax=Liparis tanakae TaxID=230148 RepID=A0A4Z2IRG1_9TELE|nr:hypothetical protein EYF80_009625 [Liparis tanakae]
MCISSSGLYFKDTILNGQDGHIKSATTKIKDEDVPFSTNLKLNYCDGSSSWFIDDTQNIEAGDCPSILSSLALRVIEFSGIVSNRYSRPTWS